MNAYTKAKSAKMVSCRRSAIVAVLTAMFVLVAMIAPAAGVGFSGAGHEGGSVYAAAKKTGFVKKAGYWYYYKNYRVAKGWQKIKKSGRTYKYYFYKSGRMATGYPKIGKSYYNFGGKNDGRMRTGWQKIKGSWYNYGTNGKLKLGWQKIKKGGKTYTYYFGSNGKMRTGLQKIGSYKYYFGSKNDGRMRYSSYQTIGGKRYYFDGKGRSVPVYTLTVVGGTVDGKKSVSLIAGTKVTVKANAAPSGKVFDKWSAGQTSQSFTYSMPKGNVTLTASYKAADTGTNTDTGKNTDTDTGAGVPNVYIIYKGENGDKNVKMLLGQTWTDTLKNSLGKVYKVAANPNPSNIAYNAHIYVYAAKDFKNYLEVTVNDRTGKVTGWKTNQNTIAVWNGRDIKVGENKSSYDSLVNSFLDKFWSDDYIGLNPENQPRITLFTKYNSEGYSIDTGKVLWGYVETPTLALAFSEEDQFENNDGSEMAITDAEILTEYYINAIRAAYGLRVLEHSDIMYRNTTTAFGAGVKETAEDYAAYGSINKEHKAPGVINSAWKDVTPGGLTVYFEEYIENLNDYILYGGECLYGGANLRAAEAWYLSAGHRAIILKEETFVFNNGSIKFQSSRFAVGMAKDLTGIACLRIGESAV